MTDATTLDIDALAQAFSTGDVDGVLSFYTDDHDHIEIDAGAPPSEPRTRTGGEAMEYLRNAVGSAGDGAVTFGMENRVVGDERAACTISCNFPDGRRLLSNTIFDVRGGKIVRQLDIQVMDPG